MNLCTYDMVLVIGGYCLNRAVAMTEAVSVQYKWYVPMVQRYVHKLWYWSRAIGGWCAILWPLSLYLGRSCLNRRAVAEAEALSVHYKWYVHMV
jgi:hypothetical protein